MRSNAILITGGTGYLGSSLAKEMVQNAREVHLLVRDKSKLDPLCEVSGKIHLHIYDGTTLGLTRILEKAKPLSVFHLASNFIAEHKSQDVDDLISSNILLGTQLLEAMAVVGIKFLINTGTSWQHYQSEPESPVCLYAATKSAFEKIVDFYRDASGIQAITLKLFDTYGPKDPRKKLFWALRQALRTGQPIALSPGGQLLDLVYISDVVEAFIMAERRLFESTVSAHESYGVSSGQLYSLKQVVACYQEMLGREVPVIWGAKPYRKREVMSPWTDFASLPGWRAKISLQDGIRLMEAV